MRQDRVQQPQTLVITVPLAIRQRGGRKAVIVPDNDEASATNDPADPSVLTAIVRAYRLQQMLENGAYATMKELAKAEKLSTSYVSRVLRLTTLEPGEVERLLSG